MKERVLPDLDLARIVPLAPDQQHAALEKMSVGRPPYTYHPFRNRSLDILNITAGPLADLPRTPWHTIAGDIRRMGTSADEIDANLRVGEGLYKFVSEHDIKGRRHEFPPLPLGMSEKVVYWSSAVIAIDGKPVAFFIDPRRDPKLTPLPRQFVFSVMHQRIRVLYPELANARLLILQFKNSPTGPRTVIPHFADDVELFSFEALDKMVRETYAIWRKILFEREAKARRETGTPGGLL